MEFEPNAYMVLMFEVRLRHLFASHIETTRNSKKSQLVTKYNGSHQLVNLSVYSCASQLFTKATSPKAIRQRHIACTSCSSCNYC